MTSVDRIQGLSGSLAVKTPVRVATTANITLSGEQTIDAVAVVEGNRVLVKNQTDTTENGIYNVSTGAWTRALDFDGANDVVDGTMVYARAGTANAELFFRVNGTEPIIPGDVAISLTPANPLATVSSFAATLLDDADAAAGRATLDAAGLSVANTFTALATFALGLTVAGAAFASRGIQDDATARVLTLSGSGANSVTIANSATVPVISTTAGSLFLTSAGQNVGLLVSGAAASGFVGLTAGGTTPAGMVISGNIIALYGQGTEQVRIIGAVGANRFITMSGSNGGDPRIGTSAGSLLLTSQTICNNNVYAANAVAITAGGAQCFGMTTTSTMGIYAGSGAPTVAAAKGSIYLRSDGTTTNNRAYINSDGGTTWTALTTAA